MPVAAPVLALLVAGAAFPQSHAALSGQQAGETEIVATAVDRHDRMTVPVRIGNHGPFAFVIDTGAQNTVLSTSVAERLALSPTATAIVVGVAGTQRVPTVDVDQIDLGRRSFSGLVAPVLSAAHIGADGIIGLDSLQGQRVLIDFTTNMMAIGDAKSLGGNKGFEIVVTARRRSGQLIMTNATIDGVPTDVVIDTGSDTSIGNRALQRALTRRSGVAGRAALTSVTGQQIMADVGTGSSVAFGPIRIEHVTIAFADAPPFAHLDLERKPAILLGMRELRTFKRVAIDFDKRKILFDIPFMLGTPTGSIIRGNQMSSSAVRGY